MAKLWKTMENQRKNIWKSDEKAMKKYGKACMAKLWKNIWKSEEKAMKKHEKQWKSMAQLWKSMEKQGKKKLLKSMVSN